MKVNIEINFDDVNYDEIEEVEDLTLYDSMDEWIDEPFASDGEYIDAEDFGHGVISRDMKLLEIRLIDGVTSV